MKRVTENKNGKGKTRNSKCWVFTGLVCLLLTTSGFSQALTGISPVSISSNHRYFRCANGQPFFWLADTGWLLFSKLDRADAARYFEDRHQKGFNVIQVMLIHDLRETDVYGDSALINRQLNAPDTDQASALPGDTSNYWNHVDYLVDLAAGKGLYLAMVPVWGSVIKSGKVTLLQAKAYATFLARRFSNKPNVIWINGGDIPGNDSMDIWNAIGHILKEKDGRHLVTFHPRGRTQSSTWFQEASWLDFNCFQSGHRRYDQDTSIGDLHYGEDNYRYVDDDYRKTPVKPTLDAEPSYEGIPQGLHDTLQPRWGAKDVRRYAYWSVFAGACGFTYGDNAVMQFHHSNEETGAYGARRDWEKALQDTGATQLIYLKRLLESHAYFQRIPDPSIIVDQRGHYDHLVATRGTTYAFIYDYTGRDFTVRPSEIRGSRYRASWFDPRNGTSQTIGTFQNKLRHRFNPPGEKRNGNDWVLVLEKAR